MKQHICRIAVMVVLFVTVGFGKEAAFGFPPRAKRQAPVVKKSKNGIPKNFAMLNLSEDQKTKINEIEDKYKEQIQTLQSQLQELQLKKNKEQTELLTPEQVAKLNELAEAAKKPRADNLAAVKKKTVDGNVGVKKEVPPTVKK